MRLVATRVEVTSTPQNLTSCFPLVVQMLPLSLERNPAFVPDGSLNTINIALLSHEQTLLIIGRFTSGCVSVSENLNRLSIVEH